MIRNNCLFFRCDHGIMDILKMKEILSFSKTGQAEIFNKMICCLGFISA